MKELAKLIRVAQGEEAADLVIKNAKVPNVFTGEIQECDVAVCGGYIAGLGKYEGTQSMDVGGAYVCPGLIDAHQHIESSLAIPGVFAKSIVPHGTLCAIADPHETANVCGNRGVEFLIENSRTAPMDFYFMAPSCVPALTGERSGAILDAAALAELIDNPSILGLGEVMNTPGVLGCEPDMLDKLALYRGRVMDGHWTGGSALQLNAYAATGISTNHECADEETVKQCVERGMYVLVREGSTSRDLEWMVRYLLRSELPLDRFCFCTDDKHLSDSKSEGHIIHNIRKAVSLGLAPIDALRMATRNAAACYGLKDLGAVAPGYFANLVVVSDLKEFTVRQVFYRGELVSEDYEPPAFAVASPPATMLHTVNIATVEPTTLRLPVSADGMANVIEIVPRHVVTKLVREEVQKKDGQFVPDGKYSKIVVVERHKASGQCGVGIVKGFGIRGGAIASTVGHDSHNLVVVGDNDADILAAIYEAQALGGGWLAVAGGKTRAALPLPVAGLMSAEQEADVISAQVEAVNEAAFKMGISREIDPFAILSFVTLSVIPEGRITPDGLFDVQKFAYIKV
ncbi:MAG: adenine deaminase [Christensenellales bacterium]|jgi:adenine deaminase